MNTKLTCLLTINVMSNIWYLIIVPLLPLELHKHGIDHEKFGYIFGIYALAVVIMSLWVGKLLKWYGRRMILNAGILLMGFAMIMFGVANYIKNGDTLFVVALMLRFMQGVASSMIQTTWLSIISISYPDKREKYLGLLESSNGLGLLSGPMIGSVLYTLFGYEATFYVGGGSFLVISSLLWIIMPRDVDESDEELLLLNLQQTNSSNEKLKPISYLDVLSNRIVIMNALAAFMCEFVSWYSEPVFAMRLAEFTDSFVLRGLIFSITPLSFCLMGLFMGIITNRFENKYVTFVGIFVWGITHIMIGPSLILPDSLIIISIGQSFFGATMMLFAVTPLPELIKHVNVKYPLRRNETSDICSGLINSMFGLGQMISPIYGSYMTKKFGFRILADTIAGLLVIFSIVYIIICNNTKLAPYDYKEREVDIERTKSNSFSSKSNQNLDK